MEHGHIAPLSDIGNSDSVGRPLDNIGAPGAPLLPATLRQRLCAEPLPQWLSKDLGLSPAATFSALDGSVWTSQLSQISPKIRRYLVNLVLMRLGEIGSTPAFAKDTHLSAGLHYLRLANRTHNALERAGLINDTARLAKMSFDELLAVPGLGITSALDLTIGAELVLADPAPPSRPTSDDDLLEEWAASADQVWVKQVGVADPRFTDLLPKDCIVLSEYLDEIFSPDFDRSSLDRAFLSNLDELERRIAEIQKQPLEESLMDILARFSRMEGQRLQVLGERFGFSGTASTTLQVAGDALGITRERVRQLQERIDERFQSIPFPLYIPALDSALEAVQKAAPIPVTQAASLLRTTDLSKVDFNTSALLQIAPLFKRRCPFAIQRRSGKALVVPSEIRGLNDILRVGRQQAGASGASNFAEVSNELEAQGTVVSSREVEVALREFSPAVLLPDGWFLWRPDTDDRDRLNNYAKHMLSVKSSISLKDLRDGIRRKYKYRKNRGNSQWALVTPPQDILKEYFTRHEAYIYDATADRVSYREVLDWRTELGETERALVDIILAEPTQLIDRRTLLARAVARGVNENTANLYLSYSAVIQHVATDVWSVRGAMVDPSAVAAMQQATYTRPKERRLLESGWTADGRLWVGIRLPEQPALRVYAMPGAMKHYIGSRRFSATDSEGNRFGEIVVQENGSAYGAGQFLRQKGGDEGDVLVFYFDLATSQAELELGGDEILEELVG